MQDILERIDNNLNKEISEDAYNPSDIRNGDHVLNTDISDAPRLVENIRPAAVLVPIVKYRQELNILLTLRSDHLPSHAGQVAFPGGKVEQNDITPVDTALRETEEEVGIDRSHVEILGSLDSYQTASGFRILPIVGMINEGYSYKIDTNEVADIFEVPLDFLMSPDNHKKESMVWKNKERFFYSMPWQDRYIWGATAGIIRNLYERLYS